MGLFAYADIPVLIRIQIQPLLRPVRTTWTWIVLLALCACAAREEKLLNSERIEETFGSYGVEILSSDERGRVSNLYSVTSTGPVTRTFAVIEFAGTVRPAYRDEHRCILSGESIGAVFKSSGWRIEKRHLFIGEFEVSPEFELLAELMQIGLPAALAAHAYLFEISKEERRFSYATIVEIHHPDYLRATDLREIYGEILFDDSGRDSIGDFIDPALLPQPAAR